MSAHRLMLTQFEQNGLPHSQPEVTTPNGLSAHRRVSQMAASVTSERSHSPVSRTGTPSVHHDPNIAPQHLFDGASAHPEHQLNGSSPSLPAVHALNQPSPPGANAISHDRPAESLSYDQLLAANTTLRTRVSELEVINMVYSDNENTLRKERDRAFRERDELKRRVEELEHKLREVDDHQERASKKPRLSQEPQE